MKKILITIAVVGIILTGGVVLYADKVSNEKQLNVQDNKFEAPGDVKIFKISASNFKYDAVEIRVKKGDKVRIDLNVAQGFHDLVVQQYAVATQKVQGPGNTSVEFVADKEGKFEYYCSVGTHRQMGMIGMLIVE